MGVGPLGETLGGGPQETQCRRNLVGNGRQRCVGLVHLLDKVGEGAELASVLDRRRRGFPGT